MDCNQHGTPLEAATCSDTWSCVLQVWALLLETTHPRLASDVIYVAGDRVVRAAA